MLGRGEVAFLDAVARAGLHHPPRQIDAQPPDRVARPAAAVALDRERVLGRQHAAAAQRLGVDQEVALLAEQPEAVVHFPGNLHRAISALGGGELGGADHQRRKNESDPSQAAAPA